MTTADDDARRIEVELEVPGTPEQVWAAIATGPGITAWFMPAEVEGCEGGTVIHGPGQEMSSEGTVSVWNPPHHFAYRESFSPSGDIAEQSIATEFLVQARGGGTCVVRIVASGFGPEEDWEKAIESFTLGWSVALKDLRLYLTHFPGQACAPITVSGSASLEGQSAWTRMAAALGLPESPAHGERVATSAPGVPALGGTVEFFDEGVLTLLVDEPAPGLGFVGAGGPGDEVYTFIRAHLFGDDAAAIAARDEPQWHAWMQEHFA